MAKKKMLPDPPIKEDLLSGEDTAPADEAVEDAFAEYDEAASLPSSEADLDMEMQAENPAEFDSPAEDHLSEDFPGDPSLQSLPNENAGEGVPPLLIEDESEDYGSLLAAMGEGQTTELPPLTNDMENALMEEDTLPDASSAENAVDLENNAENAHANWSPSYTAAHKRVLTINAGEELETAQDQEAALWHGIQNAYRTRRILTGTLDGVERTESGLRLAVVNYNGFRVAIPLKEMMLDDNNVPNGRHYSDQMERLIRILSSRLGAEIDFVVKGIENKTRSIVASRKEAMLKKRKTFYLDEDVQGQCMIYEGRVVQARVISVSDKMIRVEVFGVECIIHAQGLTWGWIGDAHEMFSVGDRVLVRVLTIQKDDVEHIEITADVRSVYAESSREELKKCQLQSMYAGRVTDLRRGVIYVRLNNGVSGIAHSCFDRRMPGKNDDVSFVVTRLDEEFGIAVGIITRVIKQNL